ncbi:MAG: hypothetical protein AB1798_06235, partial [Spirochaetota bacterium]
LKDIERYKKNDGNFIFLLSRCNEVLGNLDSAIVISERGIKLFPDDLRFKKMLIRLSDIYRNRMALEFQKENSDNQLPLELLSDIIALTRDYEVKNKLLDLYFSRGGKSAGAILEKLSYKKTVVKEQISKEDIDSFFNTGEIRDKVKLLRFLQLIEGKELISYTVEKLKNFTGDVILDVDDNGYFEEMISYSGGIIQRYRVDENQDGISEYEITFEQGKPAKFEKRKDSTSQILMFGDYPAVTDLILTKNDRQVIYNFPSETVFFPCMERGNEDVLFIPAINRELEITEGYARTVSLSITEEVPKVKGGSDSESGRTVIKWKPLVDSLIWQREEIASRDVPRYITIFHGDNIVLGERDYNRDNLFEVKEKYENGKLSSIQYDSNNNNIPEYTLFLYPDRNVQSWDFNDDGLADCTEYGAEGGVIIREYSSGMNGLFDTKIEYRGNTIIRITRNRISMDVFRDKQTNIFWIGLRPEALISIPPNYNGLLVVGNKKYLVFQISGIRYVEVVD